MRILEELTRVRVLICLVVAQLAIQFVLIAASPTRPDGSLESSAVDVEAIAYATLMVAWIAAFFAHRVLLYRRLERHETRDDSGSPVQPSQEIQAQGALLASLGFRLLGQYAYRFPWQSWKAGWVFSHPDRGIEVRLSRGKPLSLTSRWVDEFQLITVRDWPGRVVDLPGARLVATRGSVMSICERHARESAEISQTRGRPVAMTSLGQALALDVPDRLVSKAIMRADAMAPVSLMSYIAAVSAASFVVASALHLI